MNVIGISHMANWTVSNALGVYYQHAAHRFAADVPEISQDATRPLHFFRGMLHFQPSPAYLASLRARGFHPSVFRFAEGAERNLLRQWRENTSDVIRRFLGNPSLLGDRPVLCGHSAGGLTVYSLAALADGGDIAALRRELPGLGDVSVAAMENLADRLSASALFVTIASPLHGISLTRVGRCVNRHFVEPRLPLLFSGITRRNLDAFYRRVGRRPEDVIDANLVSSLGAPSYHGGSVSRLSSRMIQGGMRLFSPFLDHESVNDGIVPLETAVLDGPAQRLAPFDHLRLVETPEAAGALADLIRSVETVSERESGEISVERPSAPWPWGTQEGFFQKTG